MEKTYKSKGWLPITIIGVLFFIFGFVTWLNGILIPYLKIACQLSDFQALFVAFMFYISYTIMALPSAWILKRTGLKNGMTWGLMIMALGTIIFIPAAITRIYGLFLTGLFIMGSGLALLQTAANPYVTIVGPIESAARRISIMGICNKLAGAIAPIILGYYILNNADAFVESLSGLSEDALMLKLNELSRRVIAPYSVMTLILVALGIGISFSPLPKLDLPEEESQNNEESKHTSVWQFPYLILGVMALFFYVGVEVIAGDTITTHGKALGIPLDTAKTFTSFTMISMTLGYIIGITLTPKYLSQERMLQVSAITGILISIAAMPLSGTASVVFVELLGLANAMIWPTIWPLAIRGLGRFTNTGSALLIMAISGGAILPLAWGKLSDIFNTQIAYWILIPGYVFILLYGLWGYRIKKWR